MSLVSQMILMTLNNFAKFHSLAIPEKNEKKMPQSTDFLSRRRGKLSQNVAMALVFRMTLDGIYDAE